MCLYPRLVRNPKYKANKKNGGVIPPCYDLRVAAIPIGCGNCMECRKKKADEWRVRLLEDVREHKNGKFVTLTFSNEEYKNLCEHFKGSEGYELDNAVASLAVRRFTERWRKKYKKTIRHWLTTELGHGATEHLHLHGIVWTNEDMDEVERIWKYGYVWKGKMYNGRLQNYVNERTANYITKYVLKVDFKHKEYKPIILCSKGIGGNYIKSARANNNKYEEDKTRDCYFATNGSKLNLPIYYRNKLYTDEEKEKLWIKRIDEQKRYINGELIDVSQDNNKYYTILKKAREKNRRLGYGNCHVNWNRREYEEQLRILKQSKRINTQNALNTC